MSPNQTMSFMIDFQNRDDIVLSLFKHKDDLPWLNKSREQALEQFKQTRLPNRKVEHWKYNDTSFLSNSFQLIEKPTKPLDKNLTDKNRIGFDSAIEIVFVDGYLATPLSSLSLPQGVTITHFDEINERQQAIVLSQENSQLAKRNLLLSLNEVICQNGILIEVEKNQVISQPVYLRYIYSDIKTPSIASQKTVVKLNQSSQLTLVEHFESDSSENILLSLQQTFLCLDENSQINHHRLNLENEKSHQVSQVKTTLAANAVLNSFYLGLGSMINKTDIDILHQGSNAECNLTGIYLPANKQTIDYHLNTEHRVPHCNTNEIFRGIVADQASATFNGKIHIFQDAQKSDAYLNNKNLLLTNQAEVNTKPELEIYADDVVCAHGATVAQLDNQTIYYMQTRGISKIQARKMLSIAFVQELLNQLSLDAIKDYLTNLLDKHMLRIE